MKLMKAARCQRFAEAGKNLKQERGVTGLETAIILIAFVVVASVFAFTVLSTSYDRKWCMERMREVAYPAG